MTHFPGLPEAATYREVVARFPEPLRRLDPFTRALLYGPSPFTLGERELIAAFVSALNRCEYCVRSHLPAARAHGLDERLAAVEHGLERLAAGDRLLPVLRYLRKVTLEPAAVTESDAQEIVAAGWSEDAILHAACLAGYWGMINRIVNGLGIAADEAYYEAIGPQLAREGQAIHAELTVAVPEKPLS